MQDGVEILLVISCYKNQGLSPSLTSYIVIVSFINDLKPLKGSLGAIHIQSKNGYEPGLAWVERLKVTRKCVGCFTPFFHTISIGANILIWCKKYPLKLKN